MYTFNTWTNPILTNFAQGRNSPVNEYTDNLTKIHGNHTFKIGGNVRFTKQWGYNDAGIYPNESLSTRSPATRLPPAPTRPESPAPRSPPSRACTTTCSAASVPSPRPTTAT